MYPSLPVVEADSEADRRLLEAIADWCDRYTPLVGLDPPDGLLLDVTGCAHLFGGESGAGPRSVCCGSTQQGFARARRGCRHGRLRLGRRALWQAGHRPARRNRSRGAAAADRGAARRCRDRRRPENRRPHLRRRSRHAAARAVRRALRQDAAAPSRSGAGPRRRADHAAPAGAGGDGRAALSRADRARGRRARHHRASGASACAGAGAARRGRTARSRWRCFAPTARCIGSRSAPARRCAIPRACESCSRSGSPSSATPAIRASATTWCGSRRWSPSAPIRRRPASPGPTTPRNWRI